MKQFRLLCLAALMSLATSLFASYDGAPMTPEPITAENYPLYGLTADNYTDYLGAYVINNAARLYGFAEIVNSYTSNALTSYTYVYLTEDIVVNENCVATVDAGNTPLYEWTPMGTSGYDRPIFFNGQGHTISGLYFNNTVDANVQNGGGNKVGLFSEFVLGKISNLGIVDSYFCGNKSVGSIAGTINTQYFHLNVEISNCFSDAVVIAGSSSGGLVGSAYSSKTVITDCCFSGRAHTDAGSDTGGICGYAQSLSISNCLSVGEVTCTQWSSTGAICHADQAVVTNCYYLEGSAHNTNGTLLYGVHSNYGSEDKQGQAVTVASAQLASGEVCWLLSGSDNASTSSWSQLLPTDTIPQVLGTQRVYAIGGAYCDGTPKASTYYSNTAGTYTIDAH